MKLTAFGIIVKKRLIDKGMTQTELAKLLGINKQYLSKIIVGIRSGGKYKKRIIDILDIDRQDVA